MEIIEEMYSKVDSYFRLEYWVVDVSKLSGLLKEINRFSVISIKIAMWFFIKNHNSDIYMELEQSSNKAIMALSYVKELSVITKAVQYWHTYC